MTDAVYLQGTVIRPSISFQTVLFGGRTRIRVRRIGPDYPGAFAIVDMPCGVAMAGTYGPRRSGTSGGKIAYVGAIRPHIP